MTYYNILSLKTLQFKYFKIISNNMKIFIIYIQQINNTEIFLLEN